MPIRRPRPRTDTTPGEPAAASASWAPRSRTLSSSCLVDGLHNCPRGCARHGVPAERRAVVARGERSRASSATSSAPIGSPFARPFARVTRSGRTPSSSNAKNVPVRPAPVCTSSRQRRLELGGRCDEVAVERDDAALTEDRLEQDQGRPRRRRRSERVDVVRRHEAHARGRAARTGRASPGCPVTESAPSVLPWKPPSSATDTRLPGRLAGVLQRCLDRLRARVAEERLRAAEAVEAATRAPPPAPSGRGSRRARAGRAVPGPQPAARMAVTERRRRSRRRSRGTRDRRRPRRGSRRHARSSGRLARTSAGAARALVTTCHWRWSRDDRRLADLGGDAEPGRPRRGESFGTIPPSNAPASSSSSAASARQPCATAPST